MVTVAQLVESLTVTQVVAGSSPVGHPIFSLLNQVLRFFPNLNYIRFRIVSEFISELSW